MLWPTNSISVNETCSNHGIHQMKKSNKVILARYEVSLFDNVLFPQLNTSLLACEIRFFQYKNLRNLF